VVNATDFRWDDVPEDRPIRLLTRQMVKGEKMLVAKVHLAKGCHVAKHHHESEQISITISGAVLWKVGDEGTPEYREQIIYGGQVMVLPSNVSHSVDAIEDTLIYDVLSPIGPMGVDSQKS
jgi:quercetin dioxygenase-like cupin family protein